MPKIKFKNAPHRNISKNPIRPPSVGFHPDSHIIEITCFSSIEANSDLFLHIHETCWFLKIEKRTRTRKLRKEQGQEKNKDNRTKMRKDRVVRVRIFKQAIFHLKNLKIYQAISWWGRTRSCWGRTWRAIHPNQQEQPGQQRN